MIHPEPNPAAVVLLARRVRQERYLVLECDECGNEIEAIAEDDSYAAGSDVIDLAEAAVAAGWVIHNPTPENSMGLLRLLCPGCSAKTAAAAAKGGPCANSTNP